MRIVLASSSPRRIELLSRIRPDAVSVPSRTDEAAFDDLPPTSRVLALARAKAEHVARGEAGLVLGADTLVVLDGEALGKPETDEEARRMLVHLSGREHLVLTGLCLIRTDRGERREAVETTAVRFRALSRNEIDAYVATGEPRDKAGAYAIQGRAALFVDGITGDFYNVMGLPLARLAAMAREMGVAL